MREAAGPYRPSGARLALMGVLAFVAVAALLLLYDVRFNQDGLWFGAVSGLAAKSSMTALLLALEAMAFAGVLMLLVIRPYTARPPPFEGWVSTGGVHVDAPATDNTIVQIGCPGCGTVFEKPLTSVDEPHEQGFRCPNCGRAGRLRMGLHKPVAIRQSTCGSCGQGFSAYRETAECPHCHAPQA